MIAPSAGKRACLPSGDDADAVDPGAARDRDAPPALRAGSKDGERVVADVNPLRPAALLDRLAHDVLLRGEVDSGHQQRGDLRNAAGVIAEPRFAHRLRQQAFENRQAPSMPRW